MAAIRVAEVALAILARISHEVLEQRVAASAEVVGEELATRVLEYVRGHRLGYFPALDLFQRQGGIEPELLEAAQGIAWVACELAQQQARARLRAVFSSLSIEAVRSVAFTLPAIRVSARNAYRALSAHYTPNTVRIHLVVTSFVRGESEGMERLAARKVATRLKDGFESVEVVESRLL